MDRRERIKDLLEAAATLPPERRSEFLLRECPDDQMRHEVEQLMAADENSSFLDHSFAFRVSNEDETLGKVLEGKYVIKKKLGKGAMGQVYLADDQRIPASSCNQDLRTGIYEGG